MEPRALHKRACTLLGVLVCCGTLKAQKPATHEPIIDMHQHALPSASFGPRQTSICAPMDELPAWDPKTGAMALAESTLLHPPCAAPIKSGATDDEIMRRTLAINEQYNITAVTTGPLPFVTRWKAAGGDRVLPAIPWSPDAKPSLDELRQLIKDKQIVAFAEMTQQYRDIPVNDPSLEPFYALAEELDVPVGIHMGPGPPGVGYYTDGKYRMRLSSLLLLEDVLAKHPKMRVWAMHAGWPLGDDAVAALYAHPQLYVDVAVIDYVLPRNEFYRYLQRLVDAGFGKRIMFGTDQVLYPDTIPKAIQSIENAPFLNHEQKRDILYNNAARFLRFASDKP